MTKRTIKNLAKTALLQIHLMGLRLGIVILPLHYYVPIPNLLELRRQRERWAKRSPMVGVHIDLDDQVATLRRMSAPYQQEFAGNNAYRRATTEGFGPGYGYIEAQALHAFLRATKPSQIIEVGSGVSTYCMLEAVKLNEGDTGRIGTITCIEPFPSQWLQTAPIQLIKYPVQNIELELFDKLGDGDLLFIDSSHTVRTGGDVNFLILEVLPRLNPGVFVHFHDIFFPYDYQRTADRTIFQWMETAMLHSFLINNEHVRITFCLSHLHYDRTKSLLDIFPEYRPQPGQHGLLADSDSEFEQRDDHFPASIYIQIL